MRSSIHRLAPVALTALGIAGAMLMIFAGVFALNRTILPFDAWPLNDRLNTADAQVLARATAGTGRPRAVSGGTRARLALDPALSVAGPAPGAQALGIASGTRVAPAREPVRPQRRHSRPPALEKAHAPVKPQPAAPQPVVAAPAPAPAAVAAPPAPQTATATAWVPPGHRPGHDRTGKSLRMPAAAAPAGPEAAPAPAAAPAAPPPAAGPGLGAGRGHGHGRPSWAKRR